VLRSPAPLELDTVLSPEWLDGVLAPRYPGARVARTELVESQTTIATKVRFRVEYADSGASGAPSALCAKGYFAAESRALAHAGQVEAAFYRDVAPGLAVRIPPCVHAAIDPQSGHGLVLMHDLVAAGSSFLTPLSPYTVEQTAATLEQLARLHAHDPGGGALGGLRWLEPRLASYLGYVTEERLQDLLDDGRAARLGPGARSAKRVRRALAALAERSSARAHWLIHGDAHAGNLYLTADGEPGLVDWQVVQRGAWELDVAYHVAAVLDVRERERNERALLAHYLDARRRHGAEAPPLAEAWEEYCAALAYGYYMWAITQRVARPAIEAFVLRLGRAVETHGSLERLGA
jgi:thiamine kinase-like enzyme